MLAIVATVALACGDTNHDAEISTYNDIYEHYSGSNFNGAYDLHYTIGSEERSAQVAWAIHEATSARVQVTEPDGRSVIWIDDGELEIVCFSDEAKCYSLTAQDGYTGPDPATRSPSDTEVVLAASRSVAGVETDCFRLDGDPPLENGTECLSENGTVLYSSGLTAGSILVFMFLQAEGGQFKQADGLIDLNSAELTATHVDESPFSIELDPPYAVINLETP